VCWANRAACAVPAAENQSALLSKSSPQSVQPTGVPALARPETE
jgi:hypothetical protein